MTGTVKSSRSQTYAAYLFAHFTGTEGRPTDEQVYFALSRDGVHWTDMRNDGDPALVSTVGERGVRDPFLIRAHDGSRIYLLATDLSIYHRGGWKNGGAKTNGSTDIVIWETTDLVHWSEPRLVDVASGIPGVCFAWAPEACWDEERGRYIVYWATGSHEDNVNGDYQNMYYATTEDFVTFTDPVKWIDRDSYCIDTTMIHADDGWWYRASGDGQITIERTRNPYATSLAPDVRLETGDGVDSWAYIGSLASIFGDERLSGGYLEGPELFRLNDSDVRVVDGRAMRYGLMCDQYRLGLGYLPFRSASLASADRADWDAAADVDLGALKKRHGGILPITEAEYRAAMEAFSR